MKDYLVKATAYNNQVRAYAVRTTESRWRSSTSP